MFSIFNFSIHTYFFDYEVHTEVHGTLKGLRTFILTLHFSTIEDGNKLICRVLKMNLY